MCDTLLQKHLLRNSAQRKPAPQHIFPANFFVIGARARSAIGYSQRESSRVSHGEISAEQVAFRHGVENPRKPRGALVHFRFVGNFIEY
jgi:hypothetical protein